MAKHVSGDAMPSRVVGVRFRIGASRGLKRSRLRQPSTSEFAALTWSSLRSFKGPRFARAVKKSPPPAYPALSQRKGIAALRGAVPPRFAQPPPGP